MTGALSPRRARERPARAQRRHGVDQRPGDSGRVDTPIWRGGGARKLRALVDKYEDPADVYRIVFPPRARVRVTLKPRFGDADLAAFTRSATSTADDEQIIGRSRRNGRRKDTLTLRNPSRRSRSAYMVAYIDQRTRTLDSRYELACAAGEALSAMSTELGACAWSYFGDPRAIAHDGHTFTGWISTTGNIWVAHIRPDGSSPSGVITRASGVDDHNNPSLVFRPDGRIRCSSARTRAASCRRRACARAACATGSQEAVLDRRLPARPARQDQRARRPRLHRPNPIHAARQLWLCWRGGGWNPTFSYTRNGRDWVPARELLRLARPRSGRTRSSSATARRTSTASSPGPRRPLHNSLYDLRYGHGLLRRERPAPRQPAQRPAADRQARADLRFTRRRAARGRMTSRSPTAAGRASSTPAASATATRSSTPTTTASAGSAARSSPPARASRRSPRAARRSTTRTRGSSTSRAAPAPSTRSRRGSRPTTAHLALAPPHRRGGPYCIRPVTPRGLKNADLVPFPRWRPHDEGLHGLPHAHPRPPGRGAAGRRRSAAVVDLLEAVDRRLDAPARAFSCRAR